MKRKYLYSVGMLEEKTFWGKVFRKTFVTFYYIISKKALMTDVAGIEAHIL